MLTIEQLREKYAGEVEAFCFEILKDKAAAYITSRDVFRMLEDRLPEIETEEGVTVFLYFNARQRSIEYLQHLKVIQESDREAALRIINSLYQGILAKGGSFPGEIREVFHDHYNLLSGGGELPCLPLRKTDHTFGWGLLTGYILAALIALSMAYILLHSIQHPAPPILPTDTLQRDQGDLSRDTSYKAYRQGTPEADRVYDSSIRTTRGYLYKAADSMANSQYLKSHYLTSGKAERRSER